MILKQLESYLAAVDFPFDLSLLPTSAYLVGGSVRDALLQRQKTYIDLDFVLPQQAIETARELAHRYNGGFVVLDEARQIARVVFPQGTLDLALQAGNSLEADLHRRDFTLNAIAYNIATQQLIDPLQGLADIEQGLIRMISAANLEDDPLRLLRAYRQAAQLDFTIEENTRVAIRDRVLLLKTIAAERVQTELNYIFTSPLGNKWLAAAWSDGLLQSWLPNIAQEKIEQLTAVEKSIAYCQAQGFNFADNYSDLVILAKLATLVSSEPVTAETELSQLKYARAQIKAVVATVKQLPQLQAMKSLMSLKEQYFFFLEIKDIFPVLIIRAIATGVDSAITTPLIKRYLDPQDQVAHPQPLVTGNDLIQQLNLKPSPAIGKLLTEIQIAYIETKIATPSQALELAASLVSRLT
jgi:tRNA nucleotidyltransferase (CCA-adding enzyme)